MLPGAELLVKVIYLTITASPGGSLTCVENSTSPHDRPVCSWAVVWLGAHAKRWGALPLSFTRSHQVGLAVSHAGAQPLPEADGSALGAAGQFWVLGRAQVTGTGNEGCHKML